MKVLPYVYLNFQFSFPHSFHVNTGMVLNSGHGRFVQYYLQGFIRR
jgi:hypothetical protein